MGEWVKFKENNVNKQKNFKKFFSKRVNVNAWQVV